MTGEAIRELSKFVVAVLLLLGMVGGQPCAARSLEPPRPDPPAAPHVPV